MSNHILRRFIQTVLNFSWVQLCTYTKSTQYWKSANTEWNWKKISRSVQFLYQPARSLQLQSLSLDTDSVTKAIFFLHQNIPEKLTFDGWLIGLCLLTWVYLLSALRLTAMDWQADQFSGWGYNQAWYDWKIMFILSFLLLFGALLTPLLSKEQQVRGTSSLW